MLSYYENLIIFGIRVPENLECYQNEHIDLKCEMTLSREWGGTAGMYIKFYAEIISCLI